MLQGGGLGFGVFRGGRGGERLVYPAPPRAAPPACLIDSALPRLRVAEATPSASGRAGARLGPQRQIRFKHVRFNRAHARVTYEGEARLSCTAAAAAAAAAAVLPPPPPRVTSHAHTLPERSSGRPRCRAARQHQ